MSSSCGELGLRIALCDLIERLKRCEQKCSYLEECRHELIKEVMRLKLENEYLTNTCRNNNLMSESNQLALNSNPFNQFYNNNNNLMIRPINELKPENKSIVKTVDYNMNGSDSDNKDESWQQITVRLLQDLKRDLANGHNGYTVDTQKAFTPFPDDSKDVIEAAFQDKHINSEKETIIAINDSLNETTDQTLIDDKNYLLIKRQKQSKASQIEDLAISGYNNNRYSLGLSKDHIKDEIFNNRSEKSSEEQNSEQIQRRNANYFSLFEGKPGIDNNSESINAFSSAVSYLKRDLNEVFEALTTQNEKLNKLKAKQLRNYFKRQLNFDQNFHQTSTPLKIDPKFNHQNY